MGPFSPSYGNLYILVAVDYVTKWVGAVALSDNNSQSIVKFVKKNIFTDFGVPYAILYNHDVHFNNGPFRALLAKCGLKFCTSAIYHPQTSG